jgi:3-deoxy-7-phosphoheptulonate synthase
MNDQSPAARPWQANPVDKTSETDDERIKDITVLPPPEHLIRFFPIRGTEVEDLISHDPPQHPQHHGGRTTAAGGDRPCSIHDPSRRWSTRASSRRRAQARGHAGDRDAGLLREAAHHRRLEGPDQRSLPRRELPHRRGLRIARQLLIEINRLGLPAGSEFLDVISPQYIGDLISWGAIGARTTESQVHRELASGLSAPIGFKNGTDGNIRSPPTRSRPRRAAHHFLSVHKNGQVAIVQTNGNRDCHVILRGGKAPNYDAASVAAACRDWRRRSCRPLMVDCSHANSSKQHERQLVVARDIAGQIAAGSRNVFGVMVESHLTGGAQKFTPGKDDSRALEYGKSITDACIGWDESLEVLDTLSRPFASAVRNDPAATAGRQRGATRRRSVKAVYTQ